MNTIKISDQFHLLFSIIEINRSKDRDCLIEVTEFDTLPHSTYKKLKLFLT